MLDYEIIIARFVNKIKDIVFDVILKDVQLNFMCHVQEEMDI